MRGNLVTYGYPLIYIGHMSLMSGLTVKSTKIPDSPAPILGYIYYLPFMYSIILDMLDSNENTSYIVLKFCLSQILS